MRDKLVERVLRRCRKAPYDRVVMVTAKEAVALNSLWKTSVRFNVPGHCVMIYGRTVRLKTAA